MSNEEELRRELEALRNRYAVMVEMAPEAIVVFDLESGHFVEVNEAACQLFGLDRAALLATGPVEMSQPVQPDGRPSEVAAQDFIEAALTSGRPVEFDWMHVDRAGAPRPCRIQLVRLQSGDRPIVRGVLIDQRGVRATEKAHARLLRILEESSDLIGLATADGQPLFLNPAGRAQLGIPESASLEGRSILDFHPPDVVEDVLAPALEVARRTGRWRGTSEMLSRGGRRFPVSLVLIAHSDDSGEVAYVSTIARDISAERSLEESQKLESLGVLAGGIAHDFNNLLVGILGNADLLLEGLPEDSELRPLAERIETASLRAADLATQMLAYAGRTTLERNVVDLNRLLPDVEELLRASISKKARFVAEFAPEPACVQGDRTQLRQVLMNLVLNASEALDETAGKILVRTGREVPRADQLRHDFLPEGARDEPCVFLEVSDTGSGLDPADIDRIFEPFFTTKFTGRGLGLAALLGIARTHQAAITVVAREGEGTRFRLWFQPAAGDDVSAGDRGDARGESPGALRILLVEDEPTVRAVMRSTLEDAHMSVVEADDGVAGMAAFASDPNGFDVVVLDMTMPRLSGDEVLARIREVSPTQPVILTSGYSAETFVADAFTHFVPKPFRPSELQDAVAHAIEHVTGA